MAITTKDTKFKIVHFTSSNEKGKLKSIDCVPSTWISYDLETLELLTKFMPPPYTKKRSRELHNLVQKKGDYIQSWPTFPIRVIGTEDTYLKAVKMLEKLRNEDYIYTSDYNDGDQEQHDEPNPKRMKTMPPKDSVTPQVLQLSGKSMTPKDSVIPPVLQLSGKLSKPTNHSSDSDSSNDDSSENESLTAKSKSIHGSSENVSNPSNNKKPQITSVKTLKNPESVGAPSDVINYLRRIVTGIQGMKHSQDVMQNDLQILNAKLEKYMYMVEKSRGHATPSLHWTEENGIQWPLQDKNAYDRLNELLTDKNIRKDFMDTIGFIIDARTVISKNLLAVMKKFFHKDLATQFTCVKPKPGKYVLKPSVFYDCIQDVVISKSQNGGIQETVSEKSLEKTIGTILTNSKDWDKGRSHMKDLTNIIENIIGGEGIDLQ